MRVKNRLDSEKTTQIMAQKSAGEEIAMRRRRLKYRAWHRGIREMDLILGPFADAYLESSSGSELERFERLLSEEDADLLGWVMGQETPPAHVDHELIERLVAFRTRAS